MWIILLLIKLMRDFLFCWATGGLLMFFLVWRFADGEWLGWFCSLYGLYYWLGLFCIGLHSFFGHGVSIVSPYCYESASCH